MNCYNNWYRNRGGFTLIEVVAGLALLGTLLAGITVARARYTRQLAVAAKRLDAAAAADSLLMQWWQEAPDAIPLDSSGQVAASAGQTEFLWQTNEINHPTDPQEGYLIIRLALHDTHQKPSDPPLVMVDLVVAEASEEETVEEPDPNAMPSSDESPLPGEADGS